MGAFDQQVGGNHYKGLKIQLADFCHANNIPKLEGDIIYYTVRHRAKNGIEDLKKARHTLDLLIELEEKALSGEPVKPTSCATVQLMPAYTAVTSLAGMSKPKPPYPIECSECEGLGYWESHHNGKCGGTGIG